MEKVKNNMSACDEVKGLSLHQIIKTVKGLLLSGNALNRHCEELRHLWRATWLCASASSGHVIKNNYLTHKRSIGNASSQANNNDATFISAITINSQEVSAGSLFIAMKGPFKDGHDFIKDAIINGAKAVILDNRQYWEENLFGLKDVVFILVEDSFQALQDIAFYQRSLLKDIPCLGITGSSGKTTTKEMICHILSQKFKILKTEGNRNNQIGVPVTLLGLNKSHQMGVFEMGTNVPGEIPALCLLVEPKYGVITNICPAHLEGLKTLDNIKKEKLSLARDIPEDGVICLNADDPNSLIEKKDLKGKVITFGIKNKADYHATNIDMTIDKIKYVLNNKYAVELPCTGLHNVYNSLAALAICSEIIGDINFGIEHIKTFKNIGSRFEITHSKGVYFINDTYNANPGSFKAAIETLKNLKKSFNRIFVFMGDMLELGSQSKELHHEIGLCMAQVKPDGIFVVGTFCDDVCAGLYEKGISENIVKKNKKPEEILETLNLKTAPGDLVFFKGSRGMKMERFYHALLSA